MTDQLSARVEDLERQLADLRAEVRGLWNTMPPLRPVAGSPSQDAPLRFAATPPPMVPPPLPRQRLEPIEFAAGRPRRDLEALLGGRVLALVGGAAVLIGVAFFVALAINHGWIGEATRIGLASVGCAALFGLGGWLYERRGHTQAALALVGTAIAGMFCTLTAATAAYHLIPTIAALPVALGIGALGTATAVRWESQTLAGLGIGGTLVAPVLGQALTTSGMAFLAVAGTSAAVVLSWQRWHWLAVGGSAVMLGQVAVWAATDPGATSLVLVLATFAAVNLGLVLGYELRDPGAPLPASVVALVPGGALLLGALGYHGLAHGPGQPAGGWWLVAFAVTHAGAALAAALVRRVSTGVALVLLGTAIVLGDVSAAVLAGGWVLTVAWSVSAICFAALSRRFQPVSRLAELTLTGQLMLAIGHVLLFDASPDRLDHAGALGAGPTAALAMVVVASACCARLLAPSRPEVRIVLDGAAMVLLAYLTALSFHGAALLGAWAVISATLVVLSIALRDRLAGTGAIGFLALTTWHVLSISAPPSALALGLSTPGEATFGLLLVAALALGCTRAEQVPDQLRQMLLRLSVVAMLYLGSTAIVSAGGAGQQGQTLLSTYWGLCGVLGLVVGLRTGRRPLRLAGFGLLTLAAGKVFLLDLSALGSGYRVGSCFGIGFLLLGAAFAHQRLTGTEHRPAGRPAQ